MTKKFQCVICKKHFRGHGNNPSPLAEKGLCCEKCNKKVIAVRLDLLKN